LDRLFQASIKENKRLTEDHYILTFCPFKKTIKPRPGQFFMLGVDRSLDPLLKRPFSLHRILGKDFQILYRVRGKATTILKYKKTGDIINVLGPLGNGFPGLKLTMNEVHGKPILVAGGLGVAPLFSLAESIRDRKPLFFLGAKSKKELLCVNELKGIGIRPIIATDDGSAGRKGTVLNVLEDFLTHQSSITSHLLYACGPREMLRELALLVKKFRIKAYAAFEENMACGIGACLSCAINTREGFKQVCKDGPVFPLEEIVW